MIQISEKITATENLTVDDTVMLDHIQREKGRLKVVSEGGREVGIFLERGKLLQPGDILKSQCQLHFVVALASEPVVTAYTDCWLSFSKACYHLGNRHTRIQIGERWLRFMEDSVLIELVEHLGLKTKKEDAPFEPESGAYGHGHAGKASHSHGHSHSHSEDTTHQSASSHEHHAH